MDGKKAIRVLALGLAVVLSHVAPASGLWVDNPPSFQDVPPYVPFHLYLSKVHPGDWDWTPQQATRSNLGHEFDRLWFGVVGDYYEVAYTHHGRDLEQGRLVARVRPDGWVTFNMWKEGRSYTSKWGVKTVKEHVQQPDPRGRKYIREKVFTRMAPQVEVKSIAARRLIGYALVDPDSPALWAEPEGRRTLVRFVDQNQDGLLTTHELDAATSGLRGDISAADNLPPSVASTLSAQLRSVPPLVKRHQIAQAYERITRVRSGLTAAVDVARRRRATPAAGSPSRAAGAPGSATNLLMKPDGGAVAAGVVAILGLAAVAIGFALRSRKKVRRLRE